MKVALIIEYDDSEVKDMVDEEIANRFYEDVEDLLNNATSVYLRFMSDEEFEEIKGRVVDLPLC